MRTRTLLAVAATALAPLAVPAAAPAYSGGAVVFEGDVTLPVFPCPGTGCYATFTASLAAGAAVTSGGGVGVVTGLSAALNYGTTCVAGLGPGGNAGGTATLSGTNVTGSALPMTVSFGWTRVGLVGVFTGGVVGAAVFVPQGGIPQCTGGSMTATVAGAAYVSPLPPYVPAP